MAMNNLDDELSSLKIVTKDDEKLVGPARWLPRVELRCEDKHCLLLGGHQSATNTIMVWCTCPLGDTQHPEGTRLMALDAWVVEHCKGENLDDYNDEDDEDEDEKEDESSARVDELCMEQALVVRAGPNVLPKQMPLRQLLSSTLVAQGGNKELKGATFWVYWYDQPIPTKNSSAYGGLGRTWAPGPLSRNDLGVWYRARIIKCETSTGVVKIKYDVDNSEDTMYLLVAFVHFGATPPARGSRPAVLPYMDLVKDLGLPKSATSGGGGMGKGCGGRGSGGGAAADPPKKPSAAAAAAKPSPDAAASPVKSKPAGNQPKAQGRTATAAVPPAVTGTAAVPPPASAGLGVPPPPPPATAAAAAAAEPADKTKCPALKIRQLASVNPKGSFSTPKAAPKPPPLQTLAAAKLPTAAATAAAAPRGDPQPPQSKKAKLHHHQQHQQQPPGSSSCPVPKAAAVAAAAAAAPLLPAVPCPAGLRPAAPARGPRHEFDMVPLASLDPQPKGSRGEVSGGSWPPPPLSTAAWSEYEGRVRRSGRSGLVGLLCGRQEQIPIPVFNEVDQAPPPLLGEYLSVAAFESRLAADLAAARRQQPAVAAALQELQVLADAAQPRWGQECGLGYHDAVRQRELLDEQRKVERSGGGGGGGVLVTAEAMSYGADGRLLSTRPLGRGIHECGPSCSRPGCRANMQVQDKEMSYGAPGSSKRRNRSNGDNGNNGCGRWSLRCSEPLEPGDFVAPLLGRVVAAQQLMDELLLGSGAAVRASEERRLPDPPEVLLLNHFFGLWEPVLAGGCRSPLLYYVGLFAARRVEAGEELTCDFSAMAHVRRVRFPWHLVEYSWPLVIHKTRELGDMQEVAEGRIKGSLNVPSSVFKSDDTTALDEIIKGQLNGAKEVVVHCHFSKVRGPTCAQALSKQLKALGLEAGTEVKVLEGGVAAFMEQFKEDPSVVELPDGGWNPAQKH
ncbi:hypothetical protein VOLCADRAFT_120993 [Volvox carteri f. nagariensis]|uniref:Rhodanese domain-containing protein n=1 Tax=Volvox carteri f. nagariensis TaxID=3068 RepID=D8TZ85_VOLCA|nr:uncharacterized protein VOLCADRAFT_120993 [Volvox carteri f. nagariensis]EFJ47137.1 hypothetical protein VOLCADRAFT_120993 [Volvox carteri f. nagariensis]|eukprot:XP_002951686.1 hypothetical protein VOLCADRAFT_120993 [Volvox carteri f. nagariensis]